MTKKLLTALMLITGLAMAQTGSGGDASQQPSQQQPSTMPSTSDSNRQSPAATTQESQTSLKGCLKQSGDNWVLAADNGQSVNLTGDSSMLKPHDGHLVQVQGTQASDGSLQVSGVTMIAESCTSNQATSSVGGAVAGAAGATAGAVGGAVSSGAKSTEQAADATSNALASAAGQTKDAASNAANATQSAAQSAAGATQNAAEDAAHSAQNAVTPSQTPSTAPSDQSAAPGASTAQPAPRQGTQNKLPQSASPLPLLALLGLGSLVTGLIGRRK
jgi:hypothetical protein